MSVPAAGKASKKHREEARKLYRQSVREGRPLTGVQLGKRFGYTDRWGRLQIAACRDELNSGTGRAGGPGEAERDDDDRNAGDDIGRSTPAKPIRRRNPSPKRSERPEGSAAAAVESASEPPGSVPTRDATSRDHRPSGQDRESHVASPPGLRADRPGRGTVGKPKYQNGNGQERSARRSLGAIADLGNDSTQIGTEARQLGNVTTETGKVTWHSGNGTPQRNDTSQRQAKVPPPPTRAPQSPEPERVADKARSAMTTVAVLLVAVVAGVASYDHQRVLADQAGEGWRAWLWPLSVDGLVIAASMSIRTRRWAGEKVGAVPWVSLLAGITASIAANLSVAEPTLVARLVAVWPPLALILAELLVHNNGHHTTRREADHDLLDTPGPPPLADPPASPLRRTR